MLVERVLELLPVNGPELKGGCNQVTCNLDSTGGGRSYLDRLVVRGREQILAIVGDVDRAHGGSVSREDGRFALTLRSERYNLDLPIAC